MITNHGVHQWRVVPGLPDTGGQNVFVNQFTAALSNLGFRITIANRGGYPHPRTGEWQTGLRYKDEHRRILYLEDGQHDFVRKEDMDERVPRLVEFLTDFLAAEGMGVDLVLSHYWDGAKVGLLYNRTLSERATHVWTPHSLGLIKKRNVSPDRWADLRIDERVAIERNLIAGGELDAIAATSSIIRQTLREDYGYSGPVVFLPPCVDPDRFHPREVSDADDMWDFLSQRSGLAPEEVRRARIVTEISRTDTTKRKNVLIKAFAVAQQRVPNSLLVVSIDDSEEEIAGELRRLIDALHIGGRVAVVGSVWEQLPTVYAVSDIYCTPSVMEGFGMSAQEAAASGVPVVASHLVPFVTEYLLGKGTAASAGEHRSDGLGGRVADSPRENHLASLHKASRGQAPDTPVVGEGAVVVRADDVEGFARALEMLMTDDELREEMGANAHRITVPYFTWPSRVSAFLERVGVRLGTAAGTTVEDLDAPAD